jgi:hypothetical protein
MTAKHLEAFQKKKTGLLSAYDQVDKLGICAAGTEEARATAEKKANLSKEEYVVAVCGQMKAGKSTLLNALVFHDTVLPFDDTVMTAKITTLRYDARPGFTVRFYDDEEWKTLRAAFAGSPEFARPFEAEVNAALAGGHLLTQWIVPGGRVVEESDISKLGRYVAVVASGGELSPFVRSVEVRHTNPLYRDVTLVDTPGINDPNEIRAKITTDWIARASAVVYVSYANRALDRADVDFVGTYLAGISRRLQVLAVNKIDKPGIDVEGLRRYIETLRTSDDPCVRKVVSPEDATVMVSSGVGLVRRARAAGRKLSPKLAELADTLEYNSPQMFEAERDGISKLEDVIGERLLSNRAQAILDTHERYLTSLFERRIQEKRDLIVEQNETRKWSSKSTMDLSAEIERLTGLAQSASCLYDDVFDTIKERVREPNEKAQLTLEKVRREIGRHYRDLLDQSGSVAERRIEGAVLLQQAIDDRYTLLLQVAQEMRGQYASAIMEALRSFQQRLEELDLLDLVQLQSRLTLSFAELQDAVDRAAEDITRASVAEVVDKEVGWWRRTFNTKAARNEAAKALAEYAEGRLKVTFSALRDKIASMPERLKDSLKRLEVEVEQARKRRLDRIREVESNRTEAERLAAAAGDRIEALADEIKSLRRAGEELGLSLSPE